VIEAINNLADFVRCYEPVFLYMMAQKNIVAKQVEQKKLTAFVENGKQRIKDLDVLISRIYEDNILGKLSDERFARMSENYEAEQKELLSKVAESEAKLREMNKAGIDFKVLLKTLREFTEIKELTPTIVNKLIQRIEVHNNDKSSGHCYVKVDIYFTAAGLIDIPSTEEIQALMTKIAANPQDYRLIAWKRENGATPFRGYTVSHQKHP